MGGNVSPILKLVVDFVSSSEVEREGEAGAMKTTC